MAETPSQQPLHEFEHDPWVSMVDSDFAGVTWVDYYPGNAVIPGPLQTREYARENWQFWQNQGAIALDDAAFDRIYGRRQAFLQAALLGRLTLSIAVEEQSFAVSPQRPIYTPKAMQGAARHIGDLVEAAHPYLEVHVLPNVSDYNRRAAAQVSSRGYIAMHYPDKPAHILDMDGRAELTVDNFDYKVVPVLHRYNTGPASMVDHEAVELLRRHEQGWAELIADQAED